MILASACAQVLGLLLGCAEVPIGQEASLLDLDRCSGDKIVCSETRSETLAVEVAAQSCSEGGLTYLELESKTALVHAPIQVEVAPDGSVWSLGVEPDGSSSASGCGSQQCPGAVDTANNPVVDSSGYPVVASDGVPYTIGDGGVMLGSSNASTRQLFLDHYSADMVPIALPALPDKSANWTDSPLARFGLDAAGNIHVVAQKLHTSSQCVTDLQSTLYAYDQDLKELRPPLTLLHAANPMLASRRADVVTIAAVSSTRQGACYTLDTTGDPTFAASQSHGVLARLDEGYPTWRQSAATSKNDGLSSSLSDASTNGEDSTYVPSWTSVSPTTSDECDSRSLMDVFVDSGGVTYLLSQYLGGPTSPTHRLILSAFEETGALRWERTLRDEPYDLSSPPNSAVCAGGLRPKALFERPGGGVVVHAPGSSEHLLVSIASSGILEWSYRIPKALGATQDPKTGRIFVLTLFSLTSTDPNSSESTDERYSVTVVSGDGAACKTYVLPEGESLGSIGRQVPFIASSHLYLTGFGLLRTYRLPAE